MTPTQLRQQLKAGIIPRYGFGEINPSPSVLIDLKGGIGGVSPEALVAALDAAVYTRIGLEK